MPVADSYVNDASPGSNFGTGLALRVDASPVLHSYLRFNVQGAGVITSATLRVWATSSQMTGYEVHGVADNTWGESTITSSNAPGFNVVSAGASGPVTASTWTSVDVTSLVQGNGLVSLMLLTTNTTALAMSSRETGANAPQLIITTAPAPTATPTATSTATATSISGGAPALASQPLTAAVVPEPAIVLSVEPSASPLPLPEPAATPTPGAGP